VRTIFLGSGGFGRESLRRLTGHDAIDLVGIVTAPGSVIHGVADELGIERVLTPARLRAPGSLAQILELEPEVLVLADYGQIVPSELLDLQHGALNLHPSLLPRHRGAIPIPAAILAGDRETGVTLMRMDAGLDTGPIVAQERVPLGDTETTPELEATLELVADHLLDESLEPWIRGELPPRPQPPEGATLTRTLRREDGRLDPSKSAVELERQVRAYQPWPGSFVETPQGRVIVWSASAGDSEGLPAGRFDELGLGVGDGERLALIEVQPAGRKRMTWEAFLRGRPSIVGTSVIPGSTTDLR
jgi:methionyl-tRNA formyltransferase